MIVQWTDEKENLYEAGIIISGAAYMRVYIKKWTKKGRSSTQSGSHFVEFQGSAPPAKPARLIETLRDQAVALGCPREKSRELREKQW